MNKKSNLNRLIRYILLLLAILAVPLNADDNLMGKAIAPHLIPGDHPFKPLLDEIFKNPKTTNDIISLQKAGFSILHIKKTSFAVIAKHYLLPGYLFKLYLESEKRLKSGQPSWKWLVNRCVGAKKINGIIERNKIIYFVVPDKWLYYLPYSQSINYQHPVVLIAKDMDIVDNFSTEYAWRHFVSYEHLDELHCILSHGTGSTYLIDNIPYTKEGKFAFIDTEYPDRTLVLSKIKRYISPVLHGYWDALSIK